MGFSDILTQLFWSNFIAFIIFLIYLAYYNISGKVNEKEKLKLEQRIVKKQKLRDENFKKLNNLYKLDKETKEIVSLSFEALIEKLQKRELKAAQVLNAFTAKCLESTAKFNSITDFNPNAQKIAQELDNSPKIKGPLHGLPFCVKEDIDVEGMDSTLGFASRLFRPAKTSAVLVKIFQDLGAISLCKTNCPQSMITFGSENPVFGETLNPKNIKCTPGGSSSGSASLVSDGGVLVALGTDQGGSVRIPGHFTGICAIKPTVHRLSRKGIVEFSPYAREILGTAGILAKEASTVCKIFQFLTENERQNNFDNSLPPISWNDSIFESKSKLRIGYYTELNCFPAIGDTIQTVLKAKDHLESLGHTLIPFDIASAIDLKTVGKVGFDLSFSDGGEHLGKIFAKEPRISEIIKDFAKGIQTSQFKKRLLIDYFLKFLNIFGIGRLSELDIIALRPGLDVPKTKDYIQCAIKRNKIVGEFIEKMKNEKLDLLLGPCFPVAGLKLKDPPIFMNAIYYTLIWNFFDLPAAVIPFGVESGSKFTENEKNTNLTSKQWESIKETKGSPIAVQIIGKPFREEQVLRILNELEKN